MPAISGGPPTPPQAFKRVRPPESPSAAARVFTAQSTGARVSVHSAGVPGASPSTRDGRRASQLPSGARPESRSRPLLDSRASFNLDGGDLLASRDILHFSRAPAQMHSGAQVARSPPPHLRHVSPHIGPQGARVPDRRAGVSGIPHRAVAPAGEPPTSCSAERRGPGRHFEFIEPAAADATTAQICRGWFQGGLWSPGADGHPQGSTSSVNSGRFVGRMTESIPANCSDLGRKGNYLSYSELEGKGNYCYGKHFVHSAPLVDAIALMCGGVVLRGKSLRI
ncbi:hypothetical protein NDU88_008962 [Pleurodeles waltl]|uniref:Uncharacterized protein n=1 Tax=Pleurodeles waltl TaxID=8319 RepID=A0AAV7PQS0_PLEWA|nr:hypothetical protein NDU88_008962 [Pleurodeles waltl]